MKMIKLAAAALIALAFAGLASAQSTTIRITGSTAFRKATMIAIQNILQPGYTYGYNGTSYTGASQAVLVGTTKTTNLPVIFKLSWSGSTAGVQTVAQQNTVTLSNWLSETQNTLTTAGTPNLNSGTAIYDAPATADVAMSDSFQASSRFTGTGYTALIDTKVGVVTFVWTKGSSNDATVQAALANVTNMTPLLARQLLAGGLPLSMLTGNSADSAVNVYPMGRDEDSGTRLDEFAESGFGIFNSPIQYQPTIGSSTTITSIAPWPANTVLGFSYPVGHSGYSSGGTLSGALNTPVDAAARDAFSTKFALLSFFGNNDANSVNGGNNNLSWNGVPYSDAAVREGKYTYWSYEHLMYRPTLTGNTKTVADQLATQILTADAVQSGVLLSTMNVSRQVEGGVISHN